MSLDELRRDIEFTFGETEGELVATAPLFALAKAGKLDTIHTMAATALLHSVYSGIESIFCLIQKSIDGRLPETPQWHRVLLETMARASDRRPSVISPECGELLEDYLAFRHRFRHGYGWRLDPAKVALKLPHLPEVVAKARGEILEFLDSFETNQRDSGTRDKADGSNDKSGDQG